MTATIVAVLSVRRIPTARPAATVKLWTGWTRQHRGGTKLAARRPQESAGVSKSMIGLDGRVVYAGGPGPYGFKPAELKDAMDEHLESL